MRKAILFIVLLFTAVYLFLVAAVNDDIKWFHRFSQSAKTNSIVEEPRRLTVHELVKEHPAFHSKSVEVEGYLNFEFENVSICTTAQSKTRNDTCFWLEVTPDPRDQVDSLAKRLRGLSGKRVKLIGIVDTSSKGHKGAFLATIFYKGDLQAKQSN